MAQSPFSYFRGAAPVMAADLAVLPNPGIVSQLCGDAHVRNLGAYAAPDGRLVFDINDFDETIRGPFEWDLKRMAASLVLAGRESGHKDLIGATAVVVCIQRYCVRRCAHSPGCPASSWSVSGAPARRESNRCMRRSKAERATPQHTLELLTEPVSTKPARHAASKR